MLLGDLWPALEKTGRWSGEKTLRNVQTGEMVPVMASHYVIHDPDSGSPLAYATVQRDITERLAAEVQVRELAAHRRELLDRLVAAQEAERSRIADDVHDDSVQALAALDLRLGMLRRKIDEAAPHLTDQIRAVQAAATEATNRLRTLLFDLESPDPAASLADCLRDAVAHMMEDADVRWELGGDLDATLAHSELVQATRIAKEALANAVRHAAASKVVITVTRIEQGVQIEISDDGVGLDPLHADSPPGHRGLTGMRDRAEVVGGHFSVERGEPQGTTIRFDLPADPSRVTVSSG